jgi:hypothetical protein
MRKRPVSFNISPRILNRIDHEAKLERRSRSDWIEKHFEDHFFKARELLEIATKSSKNNRN